MPFSRRLGLAVSTLLLTAAISAQSTPTRLSWETFAKDPKRVESFRTAVRVMKTRNIADPVAAAADFRRSWTYWANMHGYFGTTSPRGTIADWIAVRGIDVNEYGLYFANVSNVTPPDDVARAVWGQCQHSTRTAVTPYFLPWHRLYLYYFERVLQQAANDPALRLPYWDYSDPAQVDMPAEFRSPTYTDSNGDVQPNPLYENRRAPGWLGAPYSTLDPQVTDIDTLLTNPLLLDTTDAGGSSVPGFQSTLEQSPHGAVHCAVMDCPVPVMGAVPYSANDPIFWLHHANIDRMWDCWTSISGHVNPSDPNFLRQPFSYVDEQGNLVTKTVGDIINGGMVDYVYERASHCERSAPVLLTANATGTTAAQKKVSTKQQKAARLAIAKPVVLGRTTGVALNALTTRRTIALPPDNKAIDTEPRDLALRAQPAVPVRTDLALRGIHYASHPGAIFKVFLERKDDPSRRAFIGTLSFFNAGEHHHDGAADAMVEGEPDRVFDVTEALRSLDAAGLQELNIAFEAATGRAGTREVPHLNTKSGLTVDTIELRVRLRE